MFENYRPPYATVRPAWSKGWGYTDRGAWTNCLMIARTLPHEFRVARPRDRTWDAAVARSTGSTRTASLPVRSCCRCCAPPCAANAGADRVGLPMNWC